MLPTGDDRISVKLKLSIIWHRRRVVVAVLAAVAE